METWTELVARVLPEYGYRGGAEARLGRYLELVAAGNERMRLVGSAEPEVLARRHLGESLYLATMVELGGRRVVDVGSGAGFPGLGLGAGFAGLITTLVESTHKKAVFLAATVQELDLSGQIDVVNAFVARGGGGGDLGAVLGGAEWVTVRALEKMEGVPGWLGRWLGAGAGVAFWVGEERAEGWRREYGKGWEWGQFGLLPGARERGIQLARWRG